MWLLSTWVREILQLGREMTRRSDDRGLIWPQIIIINQSGAISNWTVAFRQFSISFISKFSLRRRRRFKFDRLFPWHSHLISFSSPSLHIFIWRISIFTMTEVLPPQPPTEAMEKLNLDDSNNAASASINLNEPLTVFHDPKNFNVKHPLMNTWTLWFTKTPSATGPKEHWADLLKEVITFDSVEEFWGLFPCCVGWS